MSIDTTLTNKVWDTNHYVEISIPYGQLKTTMAWCEKNCVSHWGFDEGHSEIYHFYFRSERDAMAFTLWMK